jgi:Zn-dependent peptidase ImmA (M78 family)
MMSPRTDVMRQRTLSSGFGGNPVIVSLLPILRPSAAYSADAGCGGAGLGARGEVRASEVGLLVPTTALGRHESRVVSGTISGYGEIQPDEQSPAEGAAGVTGKWHTFHATGFNRWSEGVSMSRTQHIPISGKVLAWAIEEGGFTVLSFADRIGVDPDTVRAWVSETEQPGKTQFSRIVEVLRRPSAMFFLPNPPTQTALPPNFRRAPGPSPRDVTPYERIEIRWALGLQDVARELRHDLEDERVEFPRSEEREDAPAAAARVRTWLVGPETGGAGKDPFKALKGTLEERGVFVFQLQLTPRSTAKRPSGPGIRGFSAWDDYAPVVAINTSYNAGAKLFTLAHEVGHLVARSDSSCFGFSGPGSATEPGTERWCELFASALLLPETSVVEEMGRHGYLRNRRLVDAGAVARIAEHRGVSIRAMALRLIDLDYAPRELYGIVDREFPTSEYKEGPGFGPSRDRVARRLAETGPVLSQLFVSGLRERVFSLRDSARYLRVHPSEMRSLEARLRT